MLVQCLVDYTLLNKMKTLLSKGDIIFLKTPFFLSIIIEWCKFDKKYQKKRNCEHF